MSERDQQRADKASESMERAWKLYCSIYHEFYPEDTVPLLSPRVLTEMVERLSARSAGTAPQRLLPILQAPGEHRQQVRMLWRL